MTPDKEIRSGFDPRNPAYRWNLWKKLDSRKGSFRHFYWRRIFIVLAALCVCGWFALAAGVWSVVKFHRGISEVRYVDLALPWRWHSYRASVGAHYLALGSDALEHGYPSAAINYLNASLSLAPGSLVARQRFAAAQYRLNLKSSALKTLLAGIDQAAAAGNTEYIRNFFSTAFELQDDDEANTVGSGLLPKQPDNVRIHRFIAFQVATAQYNRGHYFEAEEILSSWSLQNIPEGDILFAKCDAERGIPDEAVVRLERDLKRFAEKGAILSSLENFARQRGDVNGAYRLALMRRMANPGAPAVRVDLLYAEHAMGSAEEKREFESYCDDFKANAGALGLLAQYTVETKQPEAAERVRDLALAGGFPTAGFDLAVAEASIKTGDYRRALRALAQAHSGKGPFSRSLEALVTGMKVVALFGAGDVGAKLAYGDLLPLSNALRPSDGLVVVRQLRLLGLSDESRELLERLCAANPDSQALLAELVRLDSRARNRTGLIASLPRLLKTRKPPRDALDAALPSLSPTKDAALIAQIRDALEHSPVAPLPGEGNA